MGAVNTTAPSTHRGPYKNGRATRQQIVDASSALFARHGYTGASLREIAREVGVTPSALNRHFAGKSDLLLAVLDQWVTNTAEVVEDAGMGHGVSYFLGLVPLMGYHVEHPGLIELFLTICAEAGNEEHPAREWTRQRYARTVAVAAEELRVAAVRGDAREMTASARTSEIRRLFALMDGLELQWIARPELDLVATFAAALSRTLRRWGVDVPLMPPPPPTPLRARSDAGSSVVAPVDGSTRDGSTHDGMSRGPYRNGVERRERILEEAGRVFARRGYAGTSLREVADRVGVTGAAILRHFGSKDGLLLAVLERWDASNSTAQGIRIRTGNALLDAFPAVIAGHPDHPGFVELLLTVATEASDPTHPARDWVADRYDRIVADMMQQLERASVEGDVRAMSAAAREFEARCLYAVMDGLELQWIADPGVDLVGLFEEHFSATVEAWLAPAERVARVPEAT